MVDWICCWSSTMSRPPIKRKNAAVLWTLTLNRSWQQIHVARHMQTIVETNRAVESIKETLKQQQHHPLILCLPNKFSLRI
mmetsp:Transcript_41328/g.69030  ORF Transcript_41328/g.69030 Transcript_41328/m.69030 type:complete len:81 (-) Transcript_41328:468-710(-)